MSEAEIINHASQALLLVLLVSLPPIVVAALVGTLVSLVQALTQVQEQTLSFAFKLVAVMTVLILLSGWIGSELISYASRSFDSIKDLYFLG